MMRIILQAVLIILPLALFAIYRLATRDRRAHGEPWPVIALVGAGFALSILFYILLFFSDPREERTCSTAPRFENGELIPSQTVPCESVSIDSRRHDVQRRPGQVDEDVSISREGSVCYSAPRRENGELIPARRVPCDQIEIENREPVTDELEDVPSGN
ncbi:hypothetical protein [Ponticaulis sp.]|uniref:hypothetical protein n=1 Tax=Ponticaulis sp. TaxID=2020902 RepID=UPI000B67DF20|nr:hypothetical protein [Ponticaulis sp.]MAI89241.1 hypothetical protein [Ponticaulis sp.]OUY01233.1 MAG: hypothetical protein CBB65_01990 [Hyphomonadaceae bacterium TMED5]|tara:strand:+ start:30021 stop:30497 length:477 start_codon:yes stop_codon:yes gene_type:complete